MNILYCKTTHFTVIYCSALPYVMPYCIEPYTIPYCTALHLPYCITLNYNKLQYLYTAVCAARARHTDTLCNISVSICMVKSCICMVGVVLI